jgi:hypothetical protein
MPVQRPVVRPALTSYNERAIPIQTKREGMLWRPSCGQSSSSLCWALPRIWRRVGGAAAGAPDPTSGSKNAQGRPNGE